MDGMSQLPSPSQAPRPGSCIGSHAWATPRLYQASP